MTSKPRDLSDDDLDNVSGGVGAGAPLLNPLYYGATSDMDAIATLFQKMAQESRSAAREVRSTTMSGQMDAAMNQASQMRDAASQQMAGALVQGMISNASGGVSMAGSAMGKGSLAAEAMKGLTVDQPGKVSSNAASKLAEGYGQTAGSAGQGIGSILSSAVTQKADMAAAEAKRQGAEAKIESGSANANVTMQQMQDVIKDVRDKLSSIEQSKAESMRSITRGI